jgi:hypothetical protein
VDVNDFRMAGQPETIQRMPRMGRLLSGNRNRTYLQGSSVKS